MGLSEDYDKYLIYRFVKFWTSFRMREIIGDSSQYDEDSPETRLMIEDALDDIAEFLANKGLIVHISVENIDQVHNNESLH